MAEEKNKKPSGRRRKKPSDQDRDQPKEKRNDPETGKKLEDQLQVELEESRTKYADLFDSAPVGYLVVDRDGLVVEANLTAAAMLGKERGLLVSKPLGPYLTPGSRDSWRFHYGAVFKTGNEQQATVKLPAREEQPAMVVQLRSRPVRDRNDKVVRCRTTMTNVTALVRAEQRWKESERRFRTLAQNARDVTEQRIAQEQVAFQAQVLADVSDTVSATDNEERGNIVRMVGSTMDLTEKLKLLDLAHDSIVVNDMEGRIAFWNRGAEQTYGWTKNEAVGKICHDLLKTCFPLNPIEITARLLSQGRWNGELTHTTRSGETIIVSSRWALQRDEEGRPTGILVIDRDISQQKHAEQAMLEARRFAESVTNTVQQSLLVLDRDLKVVSANQTFYRTFQVLPEETEGHYIYEIGNRPWDIPALRTLLEGILPHDSSFEDFEVEHDFERIGRRTMLLNARRIHRETQETELILLAIVDITIRKVQERKIQEHQQQLASLTEELLFTEERERHRLAVILHDSIGQSLAFSKRELGVVQKNAPASVKDAIEYVKKQIDDAIRQTRSLTFELSPATLHTFGLEAAVEELAEQFTQREGLRCHFEATEENRPLAEQVKILLYRAARELLMNAAKHAEAPDAFIRIDRSDGQIHVVVEDNGKGFDVSRIEEMIRQKEGFGLLSIRERLTHIGGTFAIESEPGKGTKVTLTAPLHLTKRGRSRSEKP